MQRYPIEWIVMGATFLFTGFLTTKGVSAILWDMAWDLIKRPIVLVITAILLMLAITTGYSALDGIGGTEKFGNCKVRTMVEVAESGTNSVDRGEMPTRGNQRGPRWLDALDTKCLKQHPGNIWHRFVVWLHDLWERIGNAAALGTAMGVGVRVVAALPTLMSAITVLGIGSIVLAQFLPIQVIAASFLSGLFAWCFRVMKKGAR